MSTYDYLFRGVPFDERFYLQDGGGVPPIGETEIEGVEIIPDYTEKVKEYYLRKLNSEWSKDRNYELGYAGYRFPKFLGIRKLFNYDKVENLANIRKDKINNTVVSRGYGDGSNNRYENGYNQLFFDLGQKEYQDNPFATTAHEFSHSEVNKVTDYNRLNEEEVNLFRRNLKKEVELAYKNNPIDHPQNEAYHNYSPYERKADLDASRAELWRQGLFDVGTGKYKTKDGKFDKSLFDRLQNSFPFKRMRELYKDDKSIIELFNKVGDNSYKVNNYGKTKYNV